MFDQFITHFQTLLCDDAIQFFCQVIFRSYELGNETFAELEYICICIIWVWVELGLKSALPLD